MRHRLFDPILLARIQFAFTVSFHIIFPAFTIGLAAFLAFIEYQYLKTNRKVYKEIYKFWVKIFAVAFGMGVVSGVVMSYQFGTNWSIFSNRTANVLGPLLGYEVLTAFFLEASFLGIMLFGWDRVSRRMHFIATLVVAIGTLISAFWIISANSWMQTPDGFRIGDNGLLYPTNWLEIIFNPSFPYRLIHMILAAYITTGFFVCGVSALYLIRKKHIDHAKIMFKFSLIILVILTPLQLFMGDLHGLNTLKHQPQKISAMEGIWDNEKGAALRLFAIPDPVNETNKYEIAIPNLASLILTHDWDGEVKGLKNWKKDDRPPVSIVFWSFRIMVGIGILMIFVSIISAFYYLRNKLFQNNILMKIWVAMIPSGFVAILAGWFVTEVGRQPFTVYNVLRTFESTSPKIYTSQVLFSLTGFVVIYSLVFGAGIFYIVKLINSGIAIINQKEQFYDHGVESVILEQK